jgi:co-chaperonin GroES (HSP10)
MQHEVKVPPELQFEPTRIRPLCENTDCVLCYPKGEATPLEVTESTLDRVKSIIANGAVRAAGYRLKVLLIESEKGLSAGEAQVAPTLAKMGLITKTDNQKAREDRGTDTALIVDVGPAAWCQKQALGPEPWAKVGMVIKIIRYTGHSFEEPPGSGERYALINDEDVMGYYEELVNG